eukprot:15303482-Alexandrium_andersonii.AAC.1
MSVASIRAPPPVCEAARQEPCWQWKGGGSYPPRAPGRSRPGARSRCAGSRSGVSAVASAVPPRTLPCPLAIASAAGPRCRDCI